MTALTSSEVTALNSLPSYVPALAADRTGSIPMALGDRIQEALTGITPGVVTDLQTAAEVTAVADVSATAAADAVVTAVADAVGDVGAGALANDLKSKYNAAVTLINELKADLAEARALANDLKAKFNALATAIDAL